MAGCPEDNLGWQVEMRDEWGCGTDGAFTDFEKSKPASSIAADLTTQLPSRSAKSLEILPSLKTIHADFDETREINLPYNTWVPQKTERQIMEENARAQKLEDWKAQQAQIRADLERARIKPAAETRPAEASSEPGRRASASVGTDPLVRPAREANANVGADAFVRPGREATVPAAEAGKSAQASPETTLAPHNFKPQQSTPVSQQTATQKAGTQRKPQQPSTASPTERKNPTHAHLERTRRTARHA
jgi:hypothetical protein